MAAYRYEYDDTEVYTAANAACAKVSHVYKNGDGITVIEATEDLTVGEIVAVEAAVDAVIKRLHKEG